MKHHVQYERSFGSGQGFLPMGVCTDTAAAGACDGVWSPAEQGSPLVGAPLGSAAEVRDQLVELFGDPLRIAEAGS